MVKAGHCLSAAQQTIAEHATPGVMTRRFTCGLDAQPAEVAARHIVGPGGPVWQPLVLQVGAGYVVHAPAPAHDPQREWGAL